MSLKKFNEYVKEDNGFGLDGWPLPTMKKYEVIDSINMYLNLIKGKDLNKVDDTTLSELNSVLKKVISKIG